MRWKRFAVARTTNGAVIAGATVDVYMAGGTTAANVYEAHTGGSAVNQVSADSQGRYKYYVDASEYNNATRFKEIITKGSASTTIDNIPIVRWDPTVDQSLAGELTITGTGNGMTFPDGTRMTSAATLGSGVTNSGDLSFAADTDHDGVGDLTLSSGGTARLRIAGGVDIVEINHDGTWRQAATLDGSETLTNKTMTTPTIGDFTNAGHDHSDAANGGALDSPVINTGVSGTAILDEDDFASDSATQLATQQSIKAYVDAAIAALTTWIEITDWRSDDTDLVDLDWLGNFPVFNMPGDADSAVWFTFQAKDASLDYVLRLEAGFSTAESSVSISLNMDYYVVAASGDLTPASVTGTGEDEASAPSTAETRWTITGTNLVVPASDISEPNSLVLVKLWRDIDGAASNHTGDLSIIKGWMVPTAP